jgi:hypothetical protein
MPLSMHCLQNKDKNLQARVNKPDRKHQICKKPLKAGNELYLQREPYKSGEKQIICMFGHKISAKKIITCVP